VLYTGWLLCFSVCIAVCKI